MKVGKKIAKQLPRRVERFIAEHGLLVGSRQSAVVTVSSQQSAVNSPGRGGGLSTIDYRPLVVGVSGGADSVCLLHVLLQLRDKLGLDLHVAHLNHQLRGAEADADAEHVSNLARKLGIAATIEKRDVKAYQSAGRSSLEEAAREVRYAFFAEVAQAAGAGAVAVGHTADDQAETLLMHLIRGTGLLGLRGMEPLSRWRMPLTSLPLRKQGFSGLPDGTQLTVIRPLLEISREETEAYCAACELPTRLDSSNISSKYLRNRIRAELMPVLLEYNPRIREGLSRAARTVAADIAHLDEEVAVLWDSVVVERVDGVSLGNREFSALSPALQRHLLRSVLGRLLGDLRDIDLVHIEALLKVLARPAGKRLSLPGGLVLHGSYTESLITRAKNPLCPLPPLAGEHKLAIPGETMLSGWRVKAKVIENKIWPVGAGYKACLETPVNWPGLPIGRPRGIDLSGDCFDFDLTGAELVVRSRRDGDRFQPLGMCKLKKLQDFMVDAKIPRVWRDRVPLVCAGEQIIWVAGWRIDHRVRITDSTRRVLRLEFEMI